MGDVARIPMPTEVFLLPEVIEIDEKFRRSDYVINEEDEAQEIEDLAATIKTEGQLDAALVATGSKPESYVLIAGHRRRRAVILINSNRAAGDRMKLRCHVVGGDVLKKSLISNTQRKQLSPMELANWIRKLREENKWEGFQGAKKIKDYLGLNLATITQHEKFLTASIDVQQKLHSGVLTAQGALDVIAANPEKEAEVLANARELQTKKNKTREGRMTPRMKKKLQDEGKPLPTESNRIEGPTIREAIRQTPGATKAPLLLEKKLILSAIELFDSPAYGFADSAVRQWARYFVDVFAMGGGTVKTMREKFDAMVKKSFKGTKGKPEPEKITTPSGKRARKDKKEKPAKKVVAKKAIAKKKAAALKKVKPVVKKATKKTAVKKVATKKKTAVVKKAAPKKPPTKATKATSVDSNVTANTPEAA